VGWSSEKMVVVEEDGEGEKGWMERREFGG